MSSEVNMSPEAARNPALDELEVTLRFGVGSASMTLGELSAIQSGYIFQTQMDLEQPVTIEVNGAVIGRGELVQVGDKIGVRVKECSPDGRI